MHFLAKLALSMLVSSVACLVLESEREARGQFYLTNPSGATCVANDGKDGYCLFHGCRVNQLEHRGRCAFGLATCCVAEEKCGESSNANNTYFVNPLPSTKLGPCSLTIERTEKICQIRLDFIQFNLEQPDRTGACINDAFKVNGTATPVPDLCGNLTGQHMYLEVDPSKYEEPVELSVNVEDITLTSRKWIVKVVQLECDAPHKAPKGCTQYFTGQNGTVRSFNFGQETQGTRLLTGMSYPICVRQETGHCGITWRINEKDGIYAFSLSSNVTRADQEELGTPKLARTKCAENENFILIPDGRDSEGGMSERHCGLGFPESVSTKFTPFVIRANIVEGNSDKNEKNRGFSLSYVQSKC